MSSEFKVRPISREDFDRNVSKWFLGHKGWEAPPMWEFLPETGWICEREGIAHSAGWLYVTNSPLGLLEWTVTNPACGEVKRVKSLKVLVNSIKTQAKQYGVASILQFVGPDTLAKYYQKHLGFSLTEKATMAVCNLKGDK